MSVSLMYRDHYPLQDVPDDAAQTYAAHHAASDPLYAGESLRIFALRIRYEMSILDVLADHIATAFEKALRVPASKRAKVLTDALGLTAPRKRPAGHPMYVGAFVERLLDTGMSKTKAFEQTAEKFKIDVRTVRRYFLEYEEARRQPPE
jgi:hypothetical protein